MLATLLVASFAAAAALPIIGAAAQEVAPEVRKQLATHYDVNPGPLASIAPSRPAPLAGDAGTGGDGKSAPNSREPLYDLKTNSRLTPYLGLGGASARLDRVRPAAPNLTQGADPVQGYQGVAGLAYTFDKNVQFNLGYRYSNFRRQDTPVPEDTEIDRQSRDGRAMLLFKYPLGEQKK
jgi:opacity protein-like surface antigen